MSDNNLDVIIFFFALPKKSNGKGKNEMERKKLKRNSFLATFKISVKEGTVTAAQKIYFLKELNVYSSTN